MQVWYVGRNGWVILSILETKKLQFQKHNFLFTKTSCLFLIIKCYLQAKKLIYLRFGFEKRPVHWSCPANLLSFSKNVSGVKKCMYIKKKWVKESWGTNDYYTSHIIYKQENTKIILNLLSHVTFFFFILF